MAFTLSGTTITQSGIDTDLSGLAGIVGADVEVEGSGTSNSYRIVNLTNRSLEITGTLTINPEREILIFDDTCPVPSITVSGTFNLGFERNYTSITTYTRGSGLVFTRRNPAGTSIYDETGAAIYVTTAGMFRMYGTTITTRLGLAILGGYVARNATLILTDDVFLLKLTSNWDVDGLTIDGRWDGVSANEGFGSGMLIENYQTGLTQHKNYQAQNIAGSALGNSRGAAFSTSSTSTVMEDYVKANNARYDTNLWESNFMQFKNPLYGTDLVFSQLGSTASRSRAIIWVTKDIQFKLNDGVNPIEDAKIYTIDTDNGSRTTSDVDQYGAPDFRVGHDYIGTTDANGVANIDEIMTLAIVRLTSLSPVTQLDRRGKYNDTTDIFDFYIHMYKYHMITEEIAMHGTGRLIKPYRATLNENITEGDRANVIAYTKIANLNQLHDYLCHIKATDSMLPYPSPDAPLVRVSGKTLVLPTGWTLSRRNTGDVMTVDGVARTITINSDNLAITDKFDTIAGTVDNTFDIDNTNAQYIVSPNRSDIRVYNIPSGATVSISDSSSELAEGVSTTTHIELQTAYSADFEATIRIMVDGYIMNEFTADITEGIVSITAPPLIKSYGQIDGGFKVSEVNSVSTGLTGPVTINTVTKTISVTSAKHAREVFTAMMLSWTHSSLNHFTLPVSVDDVRGLTLLDGWQFDSSSLDNLGTEGYVTRDANDNITDFKYNINIVNPTNDVQWILTTDGTDSAITTETVAVNKLIDIDHTATNVSITLKEKHPLYDYIIRTEDIIKNGIIVVDKYRIINSVFVASNDKEVTVNIPVDSTFSYIDGSTVQADIHGIDKTFDEGELRLKSGTYELQDALNQIAALSTSEFKFDNKLFTINIDGSIDIAQGFYVSIDGSPLSGNLRGLFNLYDETGALFAKPEFRTIKVTLPVTWTGNDISFGWAVEDASLLTTPTVLTDASSLPVKGLLTPGDTMLFTIQTSTDMDLYLIYGGVEAEIKYARHTLVAGGLNITLVPEEESIVLYRDETLIIDDLSLGTKAWNAEIDNITVDASNRNFVIPNAIQSCELSYIYRAWRKWVEADFNRLIYGIALTGIDQTKPAEATNNAHLFNPNWYVGSNWAIDVDPTRDSAVHGLLELQASNIERNDIIQGFTQQRGGVVYVSPLANGSAPVLKIVVGFTTEALSNISNKLSMIQERTNVTGVEVTTKSQHHLINGLLHSTPGKDADGNKLLMESFGYQSANDTKIENFALANSMPHHITTITAPPHNYEYTGSIGEYITNGKYVARATEYLTPSIVMTVMNYVGVVFNKDTGLYESDPEVRFCIWNDTEDNTTAFSRFGSLVYMSQPTRVRDLAYFGKVEDVVTDKDIHIFKSEFKFESAIELDGKYFTGWRGHSGTACVVRDTDPVGTGTLNNGESIYWMNESLLNGVTGENNHILYTDVNEVASQIQTYIKPTTEIGNLKKATDDAKLWAIKATKNTQKNP